MGDRKGALVSIRVVLNMILMLSLFLDFTIKHLPHARGECDALVEYSGNLTRQELVWRR